MMYGLAILLLWTISFFFAGIEAGLLSVDPVRLRHQVKQGRSAALRLDRLTKRPERLLVTVLLVTNFANILGLLLLTKVLVARFGTLGFALAVVIALPIYLFILSVLPKSLFRRFPFRALAALGGVLEWFSILLWPVLEIGERLRQLLLGRRAAESGRIFIAREELKQIAVQSEREGSLTSTERAMIHNVVDFRNVRASDVMIPISKAVTVRPDTSIEEALRLSAANGVDRLPVISEEGEAIGLVNTLDILLEDARRDSLQRYMRRIVTARDAEPAYRIIQRLRAARLGLAAVIDSQRNLIGIVTGEDAIKRLVQSVCACGGSSAISADEIVNFDQGHSLRAILSPDDGGVVSGSNACLQGRTSIVPGLEGRLDLLRPLRIIIIRRQQTAIAIPQFERGIRQRISHLPFR
jgi:putative hemolysin